MDVILTFIGQVLTTVSLPEWAVVVIVLVSAGGAFYVGVMKGKLLPEPVVNLIAKMQRHFVSYESVEQRVDYYLRKFHLSAEFAGWLTKTLTTLFTSVPPLMVASKEQVVDVLASSFVRESVAKQREVVPSLQGMDVKSASFLVQRIMAALLMLPQVWALILKVRETIQNGGES